MATKMFKLHLSAVFIFCMILTVLRFLPNLTNSNFPAADSHNSATNVSSDAVQNKQESPPSDQVVEGGAITRSFNPIGAAAYNFIFMSAYRGGLNTFAVVGLSSKPLHKYGNPTYECLWVPANSTTGQPPITSAGYKILPDWGYGRVYTVVVVNCTFSIPVGDEKSGGKLLLRSSTNGGGDTNLNATDTIEALTEGPGTLNPSCYTSSPKYDYLYCGLPLYGDLSPQRIREWVAYHVRLFGERSYFVIQDAGGVHPEVLEVLKPWMEKGFVTLQNVREQERFHGYYHNQFLLLNDCLQRYRFDAKWMFFFDIDEFIYLPAKNGIKSVMDSFSNYTQFTFQQMPMSSQLCLAEDDGKTHRDWGIEKMVYLDVKKGIRRDCEYAIQPRNVFATGIHMSENIQGENTWNMDGRITYYHYTDHGTIGHRREPCEKLLNFTNINIDNIPYVLDTTMRKAANAVKRFELKMIGLQRTLQ